MRSPSPWRPDSAHQNGPSITFLGFYLSQGMQLIGVLSYVRGGRMKTELRIVEALQALKSALPQTAKYSLLIRLLEMAQLEALTIDSKGPRPAADQPDVVPKPLNEG